MAVVGTATIVIRAVSEKVRNDVRKSLDLAAADAAKGGEHIGENISSGIAKGIDGNKGEIKKSVESINKDIANINRLDAIGRTDFSAISQVKKASAEAKKAIEDAFGRDQRLSIVDEFNDAMRSAADAIDDVEKAAGGVGGGGGGFSSLLGRFDDFKKEGDSLFSTFTKITTAFLGISPIIFTVVNALAALVSGLFAIASAAAPAAGALLLLPGAIASIGAVIGTGILAFGGISKAVSALGKQQASGGQSARDYAKAQKAAADAVAAARDRYKKALQDEKDALLAVNDAREAAKRSIEELALSLRGATLDESQAVLRLKEAREKYAQVLNDNSASADDRQQAALDVEQAELSLDQATAKRKEITKETQKANKVGIEGSDQVVQAQKNVADAHANTLASQKAVTDALQAQKDAAQKTGAANKKLANAFARLSPEAAAFAKYLFSLRGELDKLRASAGKELFPKLTVAIKGLVKNFLPSLNKQLKGTGSALGDASISFSKALTLPGSIKNFNSFFTQNQKIVKNLGVGVGNLARAFLSLLAQSAPALTRISKGFINLTNKLVILLQKSQKSGSLVKFFDKALDRADLLGRIAVHLTQLIFNVGKTASDSGLDLLNSFDKAIVKQRDLTKAGTTGASKLRTYFDKVAVNFKAISDLFGKLSLGFLKLGNDPNIAKIARLLRDQLGPVLGEIARKSTDGAPALIGLAKSFLQVFQSIQQSSALQAFATALKSVFDVVGFFLKIPGVSTVVGTLLGILAATKGLQTGFGLLGGSKIIGFFSGLTKSASTAAVAMSAANAAAAGGSVKVNPAGIAQAATFGVGSSVLTPGKNSVLKGAGTKIKGTIAANKGAIGLAGVGAVASAGGGTGGAVQSVLGGAAAGAAIGSVIPGVGTVAGAIVGGVAGAVIHGFKQGAIDAAKNKEVVASFKDTSSALVGNFKADGLFSADAKRELSKNFVGAIKNIKDGVSSLGYALQRAGLADTDLTLEKLSDPDVYGKIATALQGLNTNTSKSVLKQIDIVRAAYNQLTLDNLGKAKESKRFVDNALSAAVALKDSNYRALLALGFSQKQALAAVNDGTNKATKALNDRIAALKNLKASFQVKIDDAQFSARIKQLITAGIIPNNRANQALTHPISNSVGGGQIESRLAKGTRSAPPGVSLVGENGPELVNFHGGESVLSNPRTRALFSRLYEQKPNNSDTLLAQILAELQKNGILSGNISIDARTIREEQRGQKVASEMRKLSYELGL